MLLLRRRVIIKQCSWLIHRPLVIEERHHLPQTGISKHYRPDPHIPYTRYGGLMVLKFQIPALLQMVSFSVIPSPLVGFLRIA